MDMQTRPNAVNTAVKFLYLTLLIGLVGGLITLAKIANGTVHVDLPPHIPMHNFMLGIAGVFLIKLFIQYWFIRMIGAGRNWARIIYLLLCVIGIIIMTTRFHELVAAGMFYFIPTILDTVIGIFACYFLFTKEANHWFHQAK